MPRYIDADPLMQEDFSQMWNDVADQPIFEHIIEQTPTADVVEVKHGQWVEQLDGTHYCSECGHDATYTYDGTEVCGIACPFCGAKMDGKE